MTQKEIRECLVKQGADHVDSRARLIKSIGQLLQKDSYVLTCTNTDEEFFWYDVTATCHKDFAPQGMSQFTTFLEDGSLRYYNLDKEKPETIKFCFVDGISSIHTGRVL